MQHLPRHRPREGEEVTKREAIEWLIEQDVVLCRNAERNREILRERYLNGRTVERLEEMFNMSKSQINRVIRDYGNPIMIKLSKMTLE